MNMKGFSLIQHKLIPTALIVGNIAVAHIIYLIAKGDYSYILWATAASIIALTIGTVQANKYLLIVGIVSYLLLLVF